MNIDTATTIFSALLLAGVLIAAGLAHYRRQHRLKLRLIMELFKAYFNGDIPLDQLSSRTKQIADLHLMQSAEFYSLAIAAFQRAVDARRAQRPDAQKDDKELIGLLASLKNVFGLPDLYRIEGWRTGRE